MITIAKHSVVSIHYTLTDHADGQVLDSSEGNEAMVYLHGENNLIPGLEAELTGKTVSDKLDVSIAPADAYGEYEASLLHDVPRSNFDSAPNLDIGMQFQAPNDQGSTQVFTIVSLSDDVVGIDGNHPLAGKTLDFKVEITAIREASEEEIAHGHVHGEGGHAH